MHGSAKGLGEDTDRSENMPGTAAGGPATSLAEYDSLSYDATSMKARGATPRMTHFDGGSPPCSPRRRRQRSRRWISVAETHRSYSSRTRTIAPTVMEIGGT
ncbi:hypothetical protein Cni_G17776 [Canna indica]|uniref:Uncharacterized protein n=1 Tax=Canna indica TaxID=4628 RepID=A0AAQ3KL36_9LILI|nr:hypothetical protein Cni_G17776 [Canna indica]